MGVHFEQPTTLRRVLDRQRPDSLVGQEQLVATSRVVRDAHQDLAARGVGETEAAENGFPQSVGHAAAEQGAGGKDRLEATDPAASGWDADLEQRARSSDEQAIPGDQVA